MTERAIARLQDPRWRLRASLWLAGICAPLWPLTHIYFWLVDPAPASDHLIIFLSWAALEVSALTIVVGCDVRKEQDEAD